MCVYLCTYCCGSLGQIYLLGQEITQDIHDSSSGALEKGPRTSGRERRGNKEKSIDPCSSF